MTTEMENLVNTVQEAQAKLNAALEGISEDELRETPAEGEWSVAQILGHVIEMQPFWMGKARLMVSQDNPNVSRTPQEQDQRLRAVAEAQGEPWPRLQRRLNEAGTQALSALRQLRPQDLSRTGQLNERTITVQQVVERTLVEHMLEHAQQVEEARRAVH